MSTLSSAAKKKYAPLLSDKDGELDEHHHHQSTPSPSSDDYSHLQASILSKKRANRTVKILALLNIALALLLSVAVITLWKDRARAPPTIRSPAGEVVKYVDVRFARDERFYGEDEVSEGLDELWRYYTGPSEGQFKVDEATARTVVPTIEVWFDRGKYDYGLSVFHQVHCLDVLRRAYYPDHYFPNQTVQKVREHKQHCLDYLRQSVMCSGDVTVDHWFNYTYTDPSFDPRLPEGEANLARRDVNWMDSYSEEYKKMTPWGRAKHAHVQWDTVHQCRDYDSLWRWVKKREMFDGVYDAYKASGRDVLDEKEAPGEVEISH
ncbi:hypothetical protein GE09DRAFT_1191673 [Coniochaeta sp. 2T2.1]|nr:hypothetical protein GE09DRAFT_1191673 [Coniochaeta sp. 2T2.1]